ncbi:hypothetical protein GHT06_013739 [Daphnia sinensis]|uniref:Uncharacterized protein n=1 Tax=Daphnia sinensis TaxID=1820382 RepID=A0AAD5KUE0_9CRUS|nr:hypothetical protein GHT06_013739 [Daphnia sinensis]
MRCLIWQRRKFSRLDEGFIYVSAAMFFQLTRILRNLFFFPRTDIRKKRGEHRLQTMQRKSFRKTLGPLNKKQSQRRNSMCVLTTARWLSKMVANCLSFSPLTKEEETLWDKVHTRVRRLSVVSPSEMKRKNQRATFGKKEEEGSLGESP